MMRINTRILPVLVGAIVASFLVVRAGDLEPAGPPAPTMLTLQELNDRLAPAPDGCFDNVGRFVVCGDGSMKDTFTDLVWLVDAACVSLNWASASVFVEQLADGQCGLTDGSFPGDWRLPTEEEWKPLLDQALANGCGAPFFPDVSGLGCCATATCPLSGLVNTTYWTSNTLVVNPTLARTAAINNGGFTQFPKVGAQFLMAVRDPR